MSHSHKIGLVLSGGGARGAAHIGVLQALLENDIRPTIVSGASAGAIVGALYAAGHAPEDMMQVVKDSNLYRLVKLGIPTTGLAKLDYLRDRLAATLPGDDFSALDLPLYVALSDLNSGQLVIRNEGPLYDIIVASSSVPLVFKPQVLDGHLFVDGGLLCNMPAFPLREQVDVLIGVNLIPLREQPIKALSGVFSTAYRCFDLAIMANTRPQLELCDIVIEPSDLADYHLFQFNRFRKMYELGYAEATKHLDELKELLAAKEVG